MAQLFAVLTSDPNLLRCELTRLDPQVPFSDEDRRNAVGVGWFAGQGEILLQRLQGGVARSLSQLAPKQESEALIYHAGELPVGASLEGDTQPFRLHKWMFAHQGRLNGFAPARARARASLPDWVQRQLGGESDSEIALGVFVRLLRESGRLDDPRLDAATAGHLLGKTARILEQFAAEAGATRNSTLNFVATDGRMLLATRHGELPLFYTLMEGTDRCTVCEIGPSTPESHPKVRAHRRMRAVAVSSVANGSGWVELPANQVLEVEPDLSVRTVSL